MIIQIPVRNLTIIWCVYLRKTLPGFRSREIIVMLCCFRWFTYSREPFYSSANIQIIRDNIAGVDIGC